MQPSKSLRMLGLPAGATAEDVKKAYRTLVKDCHPDLFPGDKTKEARSKDLGGARDEALAEIALREAARQQAATAAAPTNGHTHPHEYGCRKPSGADTRRRRPPAMVAREPVRVTLEEAFWGKSMRLRISREAVCGTCMGAGAIPARMRCGLCGGTGVARSGVGHQLRACSRCSGTGIEAVWVRCNECMDGWVMVDQEGVLNVPPGTRHGDTLSGLLADTGTINFQVEIKPSSRFDLKGRDLWVERRIKPARATKGTTLTVKGLDGTRVRVKVPAGTKDGHVLRIKGHGMPDGDGTRGNLMIRVRIS